MLRRRTFRLLVALVAGVSAPLTGPALSLAHGHAHAEAREHSTDAHHEVDEHDSPASVGGVSGHGGHAHPTIDPGHFSRFAHYLTALPAQPSMRLAIELRNQVSERPPQACESPPDPAIGRPSQPRAPPAPTTV